MQTYSPELLGALQDILPNEKYIDGKDTAGWHARSVKSNQQVSRFSARAEKARDDINETLRANDVFRAAAMPKTIRPLLFSRYDTGMSYDTHLDNAIMGGHTPVRSDVSFTVFLNPPSAYEGGELVIESPGGEQSFKLEAGHAILYPSTTLHRVAPVERGTRYVAVGWLQSLVRDAAKREIIFDLDTARRSIFQQLGKSREFDAISKAHGNLLRMWAET